MSLARTHVAARRAALPTGHCRLSSCPHRIGQPCALVGSPHRLARLLSVLPSGRRLPRRGGLRRDPHPRQAATARCLCRSACRVYQVTKPPIGPPSLRQPTNTSSSSPHPAQEALKLSMTYLFFLQQSLLPPRYFLQVLRE